MSIPLPVELERFVRSEIASGRFRSEEELICHGIRLLQERRRKLDALRAEVGPALERLARGEGVQIDAEQIKHRGRERLAQQQQER